MAFDLFFSAVIIGAGIYILYAAWQLKTKHFINGGVLRKPDDGRKCKDINGYAAYMYPRMMIFSFLTIAFGAYQLTGGTVRSAAGGGLFAVILDLAMYVVFFGYLIYYIRCARKAMNTYY